VRYAQACVILFKKSS